MYRNCVYNNRKKCIHLQTWDDDGNRVEYEYPYNPYLMLENPNGEYRSIFSNKLVKREFPSNYERNNFVKDSGIRKIYENLPPYQQFLIDNYWHSCENEDFSQHPLKICYLDIENPLPNGEGFPNVEEADSEINLLTCYDSLTKLYTVFGLKPYTPKKDNVIYKLHKNEQSLLKDFINHISNDYPDVYCGWNSNGYDIPYTINRIKRILGDSWAERLSPCGRMYEKINKAGKFGKSEKEYVIEGISCLDYQVMYQKFRQGEKPENYKLDTIGENELNVGKISYEGSLWDLSINDWEKYCDYNILDVKLVVDLDAKLDYISLTRFLAYQGLANLDKAIDTIPIVNGAIAIKARIRGEHIPTFVREASHGKNPGGFVQETKRGFQENIVSFDANSLYPSVMITLNISPETKLGRIEKIDKNIRLHHTSGKVFDMPPEKFKIYMDSQKAALSKSGHLFSQKKVGIMPIFLDGLYAKRKEMKYRGKTLEKELNDKKNVLSDEEKDALKREIQKCDTFQNAYKILLNSVYGYTGNRFAQMGDDDIATSVTLTGQAVNQKNRTLFQDYLKLKYGMSDIDCENACIAGDTDSGYFSLKCLESVGVNLLEDGKISKSFMDVCKDIEKYINTNISEWCLKTFRTLDSRIVYKREAIADRGIFLAKKHYVSHIMDDEGNPVDKFKYTGVAVVKGDMPRVIKPHVKGVIESMITHKDLKKANAIFSEAYDIFQTIPNENICKITGVNNYEAYAAKCSGLNTVKGMPAHVKAAYFHDYVLDQLEISSKYEKFHSGDKVRSLNVKTPNKYNISNIGFKDKWPEEFDKVFIVDKDAMFNKLFYKSVGSFYEAVGWTLRKPSENLKIEMDELFGEE